MQASLLLKQMPLCGMWSCHSEPTSPPDPGEGLLGSLHAARAFRHPSGSFEVQRVRRLDGVAAAPDKAGQELSLGKQDVT